MSTWPIIERFWRPLRYENPYDDKPDKQLRARKNPYYYEQIENDIGDPVEVWWRNKGFEESHYVHYKKFLWPKLSTPTADLRHNWQHELCVKRLHRSFDPAPVWALVAEPPLENQTGVLKVIKVSEILGKGKCIGPDDSFPQSNNNIKYFVDERGNLLNGQSEVNGPNCYEYIRNWRPATSKSRIFKIPFLGRRRSAADVQAAAEAKHPTPVNPYHVRKFGGRGGWDLDVLKRRGNGEKLSTGKVIDDQPEPRLSAIRIGGSYVDSYIAALLAMNFLMLLMIGLKKFGSFRKQVQLPQESLMHT